MKLPRYLSWIKNPFELLEVYFRRKFTRETYINTVAAVVGLSGFVHGFIITQSELLLFNDSFLRLFNDVIKVPGQNYSDVSDFLTHFISVLYLGELLGALLSYPFSDAFGRKTAMLVSVLSGAVTLVWYGSSTVTPNLYSAKFFLGICLGSLVCTATVFIAEVYRYDFLYFRKYSCYFLCFIDVSIVPTRSTYGLSIIQYMLRFSVFRFTLLSFL